MYRATARRHVCCSEADPLHAGVLDVNGKLFKALRLGVLVYLLVMVASHSWLSSARTTDWDLPLQVGVYPINGDGGARTDRYIESLSSEVFRSIGDFIDRESSRYGLSLEQPVRLTVGATVDEPPPAAPRDANVLAVMLWSLRLRYWSWRNGDGISPDPDIKIFVLYYDPKERSQVPHSLGLEKGLVGVVHAFAARRMDERNAFVVAHELLHTLGATDKYDPADNRPVHPDGYAEPDRQPLHPQRKAEVMGGRIPVRQDRAVIPAGLAEAVVGRTTAREIGW